MAYEPPNWLNLQWQHRRSFEINPGEVPSPQTDFPLKIEGIIPELIGKSENELAFASIDDIQLKHKIELFDSITGHFIAWTKKPLVDNGDIIYIYYDNLTTSFSQSFSVAAQDLFPVSMTWNDDGSKMYMVGNENDSIYEYNLSTNYDISTSIFSQSFSVAAQDTSPQGMAWNDDGSKMYMAGFNSNSIYEYNLSTNYDISTSIFSQSLSLTLQDIKPNDITWNDNGSKMYIVDLNTDSIYEYDVPTNYDISTSIFSQSFSVAAQDIFPHGMAWNDNGSKMYMVGNENFSIYEYNLSTNYDISTSIFSQSFSVAAQDTLLSDIAWNNDGSKMYMAGILASSVYEYNVPTNFDISPIVNKQDSAAVWSNNFVVVQHMKELSGNILDSTKFKNDMAPTGIIPNVSGTFIGNSKELDGNLTKYTLPYNNSLDTTNITISSLVFFNDVSGFQLISSKHALNDWLFTIMDSFLAVDLPIDGAQIGTFPILINTPYLVAFTIEGTTLKLYVDGNLTDTFTITPKIASIVSDLTIGDTSSGTAMDGIIDEFHMSNDAKSADWLKTEYNNIRPDSNTFFTMGAEELAPTTFDIMGYEPPNWFNARWQQRISATINADQVPSTQTDFPVLIDETFPELIGSSISQLRFASTDDIQLEYEIELFDTYTGKLIAWTKKPLVDNGDIIYIYYDNLTTSFSQSFSVAAQDSFPTGMAWNNDGSKIYVVGDVTRSIYEYNLSTNYDISTSIFSQSFSVAAQDTSPLDMTWNDDGSKMYMVGTANDSIYEYNLSTNYDISTSIFSQSLSVTLQDNTPHGMAWNDNGSKMYMVGFSTDSIYEYDLSTNYDISTSIFSQSFSTIAQDTSPHGMTWNDDGSKMYMISGNTDSIHEYNISTKYDISTSIFSQSLSVTAQDTSPQGMAWNDDGSKMYVVGFNNSSVYEYHVPTNFDISPIVDEQDSAAVWSNNYVVVQHMKELSGDIIDSTKFNNNMTPTGTIPNATMIGNAKNIDNSNDNYFITANPSLNTTDITVSAWINFSTTGFFMIVASKQFNPLDSDWAILTFLNDLSVNLLNEGTITTGEILTPGVNYMVSFTIMGATNLTIYLNGEPVHTQTIAPKPTSSISELQLGDNGGSSLLGVVDEFHMSNDAKSSDWLKTLYNNQRRTGNTFFTIGPAESVPAVFDQMGYELS